LSRPSTLDENELGSNNINVGLLSRNSTLGDSPPPESQPGHPHPSTSALLGAELLVDDRGELRGTVSGLLQVRGVSLDCGDSRTYQLVTRRHRLEAAGQSLSEHVPVLLEHAADDEAARG
jgi:hypothetical protein